VTMYVFMYLCHIMIVDWMKAKISLRFEGVILQVLTI